MCSCRQPRSRLCSTGLSRAHRFCSYAASRSRLSRLRRIAVSLPCTEAKQRRPRGPPPSTQCSDTCSLDSPFQVSGLRALRPGPARLGRESVRRRRLAANYTGPRDYADPPVPKSLYIIGIFPVGCAGIKRPTMRRQAPLRPAPCAYDERFICSD